MHPIVKCGQTRPGDPMERPYVVVPFATWQAVRTVPEREAALAEQLAAEKARTAAVLADFEAYMREHQVLIAQGNGRVW